MWLNQNLLAIFHESGGDDDSHLTDTLFQHLAVPMSIWGENDPDYEPGWEVSKATLVRNILWRYGEQCSLIGDPESMEEAIGFWSAKNLPTWQMIYKSIFYKYNPQKNLNYTISEQGSKSESGQTSKSGTDSNTGTEVHDNTDTYNEQINTSTQYGKTEEKDTSQTTTEAGSVTSGTDTETDSTDTKSIAAYNQFALTENEKDVVHSETDSDTSTSTQNTKTVTGHDESELGGTDLEGKVHTGTVDYDKSISTSDSGTHSETGSHTETGTNTRQQTFSGTMIKGDIMEALISWREYRNINIYDLIAKEFAKEFLIMIW